MKRDSNPNEASSPPPATILLLGILFLVAFTGYFKGTVLLNWTPIDPTAPLSLTLSLGVTWRCLRRSALNTQWTALVMLALTFLLGVAGAALLDGGLYKSLYIYAITLPAAWAGAILLSSNIARRRWMAITVASSALMALVVLIDPNIDYGDTYGRLTGQGTSPISAARILLAGSLICITFALDRAARFRLAFAVAGITFTLLAFQAGSKGPVASAAMSLAIVILTAQRYRGRRSVIGLAGAIVVGLIAMMLRETNSRGATRIFSFFGDDSQDIARESLWTAALEIGLRAPFGVGWGQFSSQPEFPTTFANDAYQHNIYLEVLSEAGWIAFVAFACFTLVCLRGLWRSSDALVGTQLYALAIFWLLAAQVSGDINGNRATLVLLAAGLTVVAQSRRGTQDGPNSETKFPEVDPLPSPAADESRPRRQRSATRRTAPPSNT